MLAEVEERSYLSAWITCVHRHCARHRGDVRTVSVAQYIFLDISAHFADSTKVNTGVVLEKES